MSTAFASYIGARPDPANIVIFGAGGDLSKRKLLPALAHMHRWNLIAPGSRIIGVVRQDWSTSHWRNYVHQALLTYAPDAILSHDLIEGAYARVGLVTDIELIDDYPSHYSAYSRRQHRWLRLHAGDDMLGQRVRHRLARHPRLQQ